MEQEKKDFLGNLNPETENKFDNHEVVEESPIVEQPLASEERAEIEPEIVEQSSQQVLPQAETVAPAPIVEQTALETSAIDKAHEHLLEKDSGHLNNNSDLHKIVEDLNALMRGESL